MIICEAFFSKDDIEEMLAKVKGKLIKSEKRTSRRFGQSWLFDRLGRSYSCSFSRFPVNPEGFGLSTWFQSLLSKCIDQEKIGTSFQEYLIQERMKKARLLLLTTDLKIYEIADQVGFEDMNYFFSTL